MTLDINLAVGALTGFVAGVLVGFLLREAWSIARTGHTAVVTHLPLPKPTRNVGIVLVCIALACNALVGFLLIANGRSDAERSRCIARYNELDGKARDERAAVAAEGTASELALWRDLRRQIRTGKATQQSIEDAMTRRIEALRATNRVRVNAPYPPPNLCSPGYDPSSESPTPDP